MKYIILATCVMSSLLQAADQEAFLHAGAQYVAGDYQAAISMYNAIEKKTPNAWYNLGNSYYQDDNKLEAYVAWGHALKNATGSVYASALYNRNHAAQELGVSISQEERLIARMGPRGIMLLQIIMVCVLLLLAWILKPRLSRWYMHAIAALMCVGFSVASYRLYNVSQAEWAITRQQSAVRVGPGNGYAIRSQVNPYVRLTVVDKKKDWYHIKTAVVNGWISNDDIVII